MPATTNSRYASPRFSLPFLYAGQTQKEFFVNEAYALVDMLLHSAVEAEISAPPETPSDGKIWLISDSPAGDWADRAGQLAGRQAGGWLYIMPVDGLRIFDKTSGRELFYAGSWQRPIPPSLPVGGSTVDAEMRNAFAGLIDALRDTGVFQRK